MFLAVSGGVFLFEEEPQGVSVPLRKCGARLPTSVCVSCPVLPSRLCFSAVEALPGQVNCSGRLFLDNWCGLEGLTVSFRETSVVVAVMCRLWSSKIHSCSRHF